MHRTESFRIRLLKDEIVFIGNVNLKIKKNTYGIYQNNSFKKEHSNIEFHLNEHFSVYVDVRDENFIIDDIFIKE
jgi:hypothetical protein